jgi:hypothetical protein
MFTQFQNTVLDISILPINMKFGLIQNAIGYQKVKMLNLVTTHFGALQMQLIFSGTFCICVFFAQPSEIIELVID